MSKGGGMFKLVNKEMPDTFQFSIIAGEVCSTLDLLKAGQLFQARDEKVLDRAIQFLSNAQDGRRFTERLELNERAFDASEAYGETLRVLKAISFGSLAQDKETLENVIDSLKSNLEEIKKEKRIIADKEYGKLKEFFRVMRRS